MKNQKEGVALDSRQLRIHRCVCVVLDVINYRRFRNSPQIPRHLLTTGLNLVTLTTWHSFSFLPFLLPLSAPGIHAVHTTHVFACS